MNEYKIGIIGSDTLIQNFLCLFGDLNLETLKKNSTEASLFSYIQLKKQEENLNCHFYYKLDRNPASPILIASKIEFIIILMDSKTNQNILTISNEFHKKNGHLKFIIFGDNNTPHDFTEYQQINAREKYYGHISLSCEPGKNTEEDKLIYHCLMNHCREAFKQFETYENASSHHMITPHLDNNEVTNDNGAFFWCAVSLLGIAAMTIFMILISLSPLVILSAGCAVTSLCLYGIFARSSDNNPSFIASQTPQNSLSLEPTL